MDVLANDTEHFFLQPVALIFQNELGRSDEGDYGYNTTPSAEVRENRSGETWKAEEVVMSEPQRLEKIGDVIRKELRWTFILHTYGFGCLFFILAFYTFFSILNIRSFISSRPFMSTINGFLCLLGSSRAASLFIDPYNLKENMPRLFGQVLWDLGFPSIISAFSLVQLAFLQITQFQVGPEGLRRKSCLSLIVTAHFLLTIAMDIVVASHENLMVMKHVVHYVFLTWGVFLCSNFLYSGYKIMSMIKSSPEGFKHRDLPDPSYKGIMQLAMLAPHANLAGSMTAALLPTLCAPKIHQQDNTNLSSVGFKSDGNSRILESESIPMLEEMTGSSGDETSPKPLVRASSFQNQTRNSQKVKLKPKLYFKSISDEDFPQGKRKSGRDQSPKSPPVKTNDPDLGGKPAGGILKNKESITASITTSITTSQSREFKRKVSQRTSFENENFCFPSERKENALPEILVSHPSQNDGDKEQKSLSKLMSEITKDLDEMQILREDKSNKLEEVVEVHEPARKENDENEVSKCRGSRTGDRERGDDFCESPTQVNGCSEICVSEGATTSKELSKFEETHSVPAKIRGRKKGKSLTWKKKAETEDEEATQECLLVQEQPADVTLRSVLGHMAYVGRGGPKNCDEELEKVRKSKVEWVLNITYITAMWGLMLCLSYMGKIYSPFGVPEPRRTLPRSNSTHTGPTEDLDDGPLFSSWPWLWFQTFCRALELAMGCAMANITRQPAANRRYSRALTFRHRDTFYNI